MDFTADVNETQLAILLARQGIYDQTGNVYAYELLYRTNSSESNIIITDESAGVKATSSVIAQVFANLDLDMVVNNKPFFINFTYTDIILTIPRLLPPERIVIEVSELATINTLLISALTELHDDGYKIALDNFIYNENHAPLLEIADFVKIDVLNESKEAILTKLQPLKAYQGKLLAERIDNKDQFHLCAELGFHYFQGFFLNKPDVIKGQIIAENTSLLLRVLTELNNEELSVEQLERTILQIPRLSYRILRVANSAYYYSGKEIKSLIDAIFRIGVTKVKNWANLILLASNPDTLQDLTERTLIRAYMCENMAKALKLNADEAYTAGMFSTLDGMLNQPLPLLLSKIQLSDELNNALLSYQGGIGSVLKAVIDYEHANFDKLADLNLDRNQVMSFYLNGIKYANATLGIVI